MLYKKFTYAIQKVHTCEHFVQHIVENGLLRVNVNFLVTFCFLCGKGKGRMGKEKREERGIEKERKRGNEK